MFDHFRETISNLTNFRNFLEATMFINRNLIKIQIKQDSKDLNLRSLTNATNILNSTNAHKTLNYNNALKTLNHTNAPKT